MKLQKIISSCLVLAISSLFILSGCHLHVIDDPQSSQSSSSSPTTSSSRSGVVEPSDNLDISPDEITPAVWKVSDENGNYIYMMGSIHAADDSVYHMPGYFETAFSQCDSLAVEIDISSVLTDMTSIIDMYKKMAYTDGTKISDHIPKQSYDRLVEILKENNLYNNLYDNYKPVLWTSLMENAALMKAGLDTSKGVDTVLINRANNENKEVLEVESFDFQIDLLNNLPDELNAMLLEQYVADGAFDKQVTDTIELYDHWKKGTLTAEATGADTTASTNEVSLTPEQEKLLEDYNNTLLVERNKNMANKAEEYMQSDNVVMFVVGAAHFYGDNGILQLMKDKGCTVIQLTEKDADKTLQTSKDISAETQQDRSDAQLSQQNAA